jgi:tetraacyldisaccharide 4'-kinase
MFKYLRLLLLPFSLLYGLIVELIKSFYKKGYLHAERFEIANIVVGNLSTGGTGKTPHVEYIIRFLKNYHHVAVLSRGYGRKKSGLRLVNLNDTVEEVGDEPLQIAQKFPEIPILVSENRLKGLEKIQRFNPRPQMVILDDAMQHWALKADFYLMLTTYQQPFFEDYVLPAGNLREFAFNYKRANAIIVSKCPSDLSKEAADLFIQKINPLPHQKVFFSYLKYGQAYRHAMPEIHLDWEELSKQQVLLVSGIADANPLEKELKSRNISFKHLKFPDHHHYTSSDWKKIMTSFEQLKSSSHHCLMLSTEKDAVRLHSLADSSIPLYILPIEVDIAFDMAPHLQRVLVEVMYKKKGYPVT